VYPHDAPAGWVPQQYRPTEVEARVYYRPGAQGREAELGELLERRRTRREAEGVSAGDRDDDRDAADSEEA
jgi:putative ATPase